MPQVILYLSLQLILPLYLLIININQLEMSDDDDWGVDSEPKAEPIVEAPPTEPARGRGSRGVISDAQPTTQKEQPKPAVVQQDEDAGWISQEKDKVNVDDIPDKEVNGRNRPRGDRDKDTTINNVRVEDNVSEVINPNQAQLQVSHNEGSSWLDEATNKKDEREDQDRGNRARGTRGNRDSAGLNSSNNDPEDDGNRRGNRGNRNGDNYNRHNQQGNGQRPWRDFNNERGYNNNRGGYGGNQNRGPRGEFHGQGGDFRKKREDGGSFRGNRQEGGGFRGNRQEGGGFRGNRQEGGGFRGNREGGGYNRGYNNRDRDFQGGNHSDRQEHRFNRNNRENGNENGSTQQSVASKQKVVTLPGGRIWPSCQLYIMGKKLSITLRKIQDFHSKLLIVPYRNLKLDYYPGNFVISSTIDYRAKIKSKGADLQKPGRVYFQKAVGLANYSAVAFLRVDDSEEGKVKSSIEEGIESIIRDLGKIKQAQKFDTIVFPVSEQLCEPAIVIRSFSNLLEECQSVKEVSLSTKDPKCFNRCMQDYRKCIMEMIDNNQLSFQ